MKIYNFGRGVHDREVKGIERFRGLPNDWYGYTNLDLVIGLGRPREIDFILVSDRRIFLIDIKDWRGKIESVDGHWVQNGIDRGNSPVRKISGIASRDVFPLLRSALSKHSETKSLPVPMVMGLVVLTGNADRSGIAPTEADSVLTIDEFLKKLSNDKEERSSFGNVPSDILRQPLTTPFWKDKIGRFFKGGSFQPGKRRFERFVAEVSPNFEHKHGIYREYEAKDETSPQNLGTLRVWDFTKCPDTRFQTESGRSEIAGREQEVFNWLRDRDEDVERTLLAPKIDDPERSVNYWEVYDRRSRLQRLRNHVSSEGKRLLPEEKIELARQLLTAVAALHRQDAAHLDLGEHSIWLETPTTVKLSHLLTAKYPDVRSLGQNRYQFLSSSQVPEEILGNDHGPKRRDVFLLGVAIHMLLFGSRPIGDPPEWDCTVDATEEFLSLHNWFEQALELDAGGRFSDAVEAHAEFQKATQTRPTPGEVISGLDSFRNVVRSQRQLFATYHEKESLKESDAVDIWRSEADNEQLLVKLWKQPAWGDLGRQGGAILSFLERARNQKADRPYGLPEIKEVMWLGDSFAVIQKWINGETLTATIARLSVEISDTKNILKLLQRIIFTLDALHDEGHAHGDLKPDNIVLKEDGTPILIDALDFGLEIDGEIISSAYAPEYGDKYQRDRYAVTCIAEELVALCELSKDLEARIFEAVQDCRDKEPVLATLSPLRDATEEALKALSNPDVADSSPEVTNVKLSIIGAATGPIEPDEGFLFVRLWRDKIGRLSLLVRGASEEIRINLENGKLASARRRSLQQRWIAQAARHEFHKLPWSISVQASDKTDISELQKFLDEPVIRERIEKELEGNVEPQISDDEEVVDTGSEDEAEDRLAEEIVLDAKSAATIDVPRLWRALIETENELKTEAIITADSYFDRRMKQHRAPIELESGTFDYARHDTVSVERLTKRGEWRRIGELDVQLSHSDLAVVSSYSPDHPAKDRWLEEGERLRFISHFEVQSLRRRTDAVERILGGNGRLTELLSVFDPRSKAIPKQLPHEIDEELLRSYDLNADQRKAFERIIHQRPVGLLQGPPGTGKTRFIAALAHYALSKGLARNVLLTSQSHEAVNTAAESVLKHFRKAGIQPSLLRVAMTEDIASPDLRPHHTQRVEQAFKDRFRASFGERLAIIGDTLGLGRDVVEDIVSLEKNIRPICTNLAQLSSEPEPDSERINSLKNTLNSHLKTIGVEKFDLNEEEIEWDVLNEKIAIELASEISRRNGVGTDQLARLRSAAAIGRDFMGSVSRSQRNFEAFLAGTRQIVAGTCVGLGRTSLGLTATAFDLVIVDEAARCTASELLVPLQAARWAVLVGDHAQLKPQHNAEVIDLVAERTSFPKYEIQRSDFERVFTTGFGAQAGARLKMQYRMLPPIGRLVSETFYPDLNLQAGREIPEIDPECLPEELNKPLIWLDTDSLGETAFEQRDRDSHSRVNRVEADAIIAQLERWHSHEPFREWLTTQEKYAAGIGIICMYAAQRDLIRRKIRQSSLGYLLDKAIKVGTVDSYQGKENPIILLSLVRNNSSGIQEFGSARIKEGFLSTPNRINVAASRAMDRLIIVGARKRWRQESPLGRLSSEFEKLIIEKVARVVDVSTFLENETKTSPKMQRIKKPTMAGGGVDA